MVRTSPQPPAAHCCPVSTSPPRRISPESGPDRRAVDTAVPAAPARHGRRRRRHGVGHSSAALNPAAASNRCRRRRRRRPSVTPTRQSASRPGRHAAAPAPTDSGHSPSLLLFSMHAKTGPRTVHTRTDDGPRRLAPDRGGEGSVLAPPGISISTLGSGKWR